ncbi:SCF ubiquitin ligase complex subunit cdc4, partial [Ascosphaera pollenicola]
MPEPPPAPATFLARPHPYSHSRLPPSDLHSTATHMDSAPRQSTGSDLHPQSAHATANSSPSSSTFPLLLSPVPRGAKNHVHFALTHNDDTDLSYSPALPRDQTNFSAIEEDGHHHHQHHEQSSIQSPAAPHIPAANQTDITISSNPAPATSARPMIFRPSSVNLSSEDVSLPSPRLSPVTASASRAAVDSTSTAISAARDPSATATLTSPSALSTEDNSEELALQRLLFPSSSSHQPHPYSLMDVPMFVDYFDSMPDKMKTYVMYQLLRRCPKSTLRPVAEAISPALKVDFLGRLPLELSLNIICHLDFRTMCRAACVSKSWRNLINSDERTWQSLFEEDGFVLSEGELERAIREGWGWQVPSNTDGAAKEHYEMNIKRGWRGPSPVPPDALPEQAESAVANAMSALKRKASFDSSSAGDSKRRLTSAPNSGGDTSAIAPGNIDVSVSGNAQVAANAAAMVVPYPGMGMPSLHNLHLYKSLYHRHHRIQQAWMQRDSKPLHLAFKAHTHHVVTCLQFDSEKILTGSDDTNINVYDTKTGALRNTLRGHEGGVWALEYVGNTLVSGSTDRSVR